MGDAVLTRRTVLRTAALATTALSAPFVRGAHAAGKLSFGVWDHWVPKESEVMVKLCNEWAEKEKVEITVDLITSNGDKDLLTLMAEGQARAGHDIMGLRMWYVSSQRSDHRAIQLFASIEKIPILRQPLSCRHRPIRVREGEAMRIAIAKAIDAAEFLANLTDQFQEFDREPSRPR